MINRINKIIGQHYKSVAQLFEIYNVDMPVNAESVSSAMYLLGDDFTKAFWSIENEVGFTGTSFLSNLFGKKETTEVDPEIEKRNKKIAALTVGVSLIIILLLLNFAVRD